MGGGGFTSAGNAGAFASDSGGGGLGTQGQPAEVLPPPPPMPPSRCESGQVKFEAARGSRGLR